MQDLIPIDPIEDPKCDLHSQLIANETLQAELSGAIRHLQRLHVTWLAGTLFFGLLALGLAALLLIPNRLSESVGSVAEAALLNSCVVAAGAIAAACAARLAALRRGMAEAKATSELNEFVIMHAGSFLDKGWSE